jgi:hypothetical protein
MFYAFCGGLGTGKTLGMVDYLEYQSKNPNNLIITNFFYKNAHYRIKSFDDLLNVLNVLCFIGRKKSENPEKAAPILPVGQKIVLALDEVGILFNSRNFGKIPPVILDFIPQMRKLGVEPIYAVQDPSLVDLNFRRFTEKYFQFKRIWKLIYRNEFRLNANEPHFDAIKDGTGSGHLGKKLNSFPVFRFLFSRRSKTLFKQYNTYEMIYSSNSDVEVDGDLRNSFERLFVDFGRQRRLRQLEARLPAAVFAAKLNPFCKKFQKNFIKNLQKL